MKLPAIDAKFDLNIENEQTPKVEHATLDEQLIQIDLKRTI